MSLLHTELSGAEFNSIYKETKFYKFLNNNLTHYGFTYKEGLNEDTKPFNPSGKCSIGGLYFCKESKCYQFWGTYGQKLAFIEIPDDAIVYVEENKFKSNKVIINKILDFSDVDDSFWINIIQKYYSVLAHIKEKNTDHYRYIIQRNNSALKYIKEQSSLLTKELCKLVVSLDSKALKYIKEQTEEICILAVQQDGKTLRFVKEQTDTICKLAVQENGDALIYVKEQTEAICTLAVQQDGDVLAHVKKQTDEICALAVSQNGVALRFVNTQTENICRQYVLQYGCALQFVNEQFRTEEICNLAVLQDVVAIEFVNDNKICKLGKLQLEKIYKELLNVQFEKKRKLDKSSIDKIHNKLAILQKLKITNLDI